MSIRVAIAGVGNCASSLVQGVEYYKDTKDEDKIPGLMHNNFGGYRVRDIEFVAAFDVDALKVGKDLSEAIEASQNNTIKFADVPNLGVEVLRGPTNDGLGEYYRQMIEESDAEPVDVAQVLRDKKVDVLVSYLPVGSEQADKAYAQAAMDAGCAFVNCLPVFIASDPEWAQKFRDAGVPIVGDDIKSQVGATITHRVLARLEQEGHLAAVVTQNIDGLHQKAGSKNVMELHGSVLRNYCERCLQFVSAEEILHSTGVPKCPKCGGPVKPDVVLYEEGLNQKTLEDAIYYISHADVLIVGGTSLAVYPAAGLIDYYNGNKLVLINKSTTPMDARADLLIQQGLGSVFEQIEV